MQNLCHFCLSTPVLPLMLHCGHLSCKRCCILCLGEDDQQTTSGIKCYQCGKVTLTQDIEDLQQINLIETQMESRHYVDEGSLSDLGGSKRLVESGHVLRRTMDPNTTNEQFSLCSHHQLELQLFCQTCSQLCCISCVHEQSTHKKHMIVPISKVMPKLQQLNKDFSTKQRATLKRIADSIRICERNRLFYENQAEMFASFIKWEFEDLMDALTNRQTELVNDVKQYFTVNVQDVLKQERQFGHVMHNLTQYSKVEAQDQSSERTTHLFQMQSNLAQQIVNLPGPPAILDDQKTVNLPFDFSNKRQILDEISLYGRLRKSSKPQNQAASSNKGTTRTSVTPQKVTTPIAMSKSKKVLPQAKENKENKVSVKSLSVSKSKDSKSNNSKVQVQKVPDSASILNDDGQFQPSYLQELKSISAILTQFQYSDLQMIFPRQTRTYTLLLRLAGNRGVDLELKGPIKHSLGVIQLENGSCFGWEVSCPNPKMDVPNYGDGCIFTLRNHLGTLPMKFQVKYDRQQEIAVFQRAGIGLGVQGKEQFDLYVNFENPRLCHSFLGPNFIMVENLDGQTLLGGSPSDWNIKMIEIFHLQQV